MDEMGYPISIRGKQKIMTRNAYHRAFASSSTNCNYVMVVECVSTDHNVLPPSVILPENNVLKAWMIYMDVPDDFSIAVSDTGY
jgi:hypothetical protein